MTGIAIGIGIMAYNEAANIGRLLERLCGQRPSCGRIVEIVVVASGCTDDTASIVAAHAGRDPRVTLLLQERREGKASAINLFLARAAGEVLVLESGDTLPDDGAIERLVAPFADPAVGMTGARAVPVDSPDHFTGHCTHLLWNLHHAIALETPKLGELVAFRRLVREIPADTAVDEASIEAVVRAAGLDLCYVPEAVVRNKGPETLADLVRQRRRIAAGHRHLAKRGYRVSTGSPWRALRALAAAGDWRGPRRFLWTAGVVVLEAWCRLLGAWDLSVRRRNPVIWDIAASTKRLD